MVTAVGVAAKASMATGAEGAGTVASDGSGVGREVQATRPARTGTTLENNILRQREKGYDILVSR